MLHTVQPLVSLITVNYNGNAVTSDFLQSITAISYKNIEVFVVDNHSKESPDTLKEKFPFIHLIKSPKNEGFAAGNNLAIKQAKGKYLFLLNNDTEVKPDFLEPIVSLMEINPKIGIASSKLLYYSEPDTIQYAGHGGINYYTGRGFSIGFGEKNNDSYHVNYRTQMGHGAAMLINRAVIDKIGLLAELYFLYYEEMDFCERAKKAGFEIWYCGSSEVFHKESISTGKNSPLKTYYLTRNRLIFTRRNAKGLQKLIALLFFMFLAFPKGIVQYALKGEVALLKAFVRGTLWNYKGNDIRANEGNVYIDY